MDDSIELGRLADLNLARSWAMFGRAVGEVGGSEQCTFVATGIPAAFFNGAYATGPVDDPDRVIADAIEFMSAHAVPWLLWVREGVDDALLEAGRRAGLVDAGGPPAMGLPRIPASPPHPDGLVVDVVRDLDGVEVFRDLGARGFEMPLEIVTALVTESLLAEPSIEMVIGTVDGEPVSSAIVAVTGTTAGIYNVATPPEHRRRGYGAALTWAAVEEGARLGCDHSVLQASELGASVYRQMGYRDLGTYVQLEGRPDATGGT